MLLFARRELHWLTLFRNGMSVAHSCKRVKKEDLAEDGRTRREGKEQSAVPNWDLPEGWYAANVLTYE